MSDKIKTGGKNVNGKCSVGSCEIEFMNNDKEKTAKIKRAEEELLRELYRNTQVALQSISGIIGEVEDEKIGALIKQQHEKYEEISAETALLAHKYGVDVKEPSVMKKAMLWTSIKLNTITDNSASHIAEMMIQGTVMGITELTKFINDNRQLAGDDVLALSDKLLATEEQNLEDFKKYL